MEMEMRVDKFSWRVVSTRPKHYFVLPQVSFGNMQQYCIKLRVDIKVFDIL